jgi:Restriction endonuclease
MLCGDSPVKAKNDGSDLQRLIRSIETALAVGNQSITVEMGKRFRDKVTGKSREHDVVLTVTNKHHQHIIALECRDRSRPVGVPDVEAFYNKCQDTGIHAPIMVSGKGFYQSALKKAAFYSIGCMSLDEAESFSWCLAAGAHNYRRFIHHTELQIIFLEGIEIDQKSLQIEDGTLITGDMIKGWGVNALNAHIPALTAEQEGENHVTVTEPHPKLFGICNGTRVQAVEAKFVIHYNTFVDFVPFRFRTYVDKGKGKEITQAAVCEVKIGDNQVAEMVLSTNEKGEINVVTLVSPAEAESKPVPPAAPTTS